MLSLQPSKCKSCVNLPGCGRSASHLTVNPLIMRTRERLQLQGLVKAIDNHPYTEMCANKLCRRSYTVADKLRTRLQSGLGPVGLELSMPLFTT